MEAHQTHTAILGRPRRKCRNLLRLGQIRTKTKHSLSRCRAKESERGTHKRLHSVAVLRLSNEVDATLLAHKNGLSSFSGSTYLQRPRAEGQFRCLPLLRSSEKSGWKAQHGIWPALLR